MNPMYSVRSRFGELRSSVLQLSLSQNSGVGGTGKRHLFGTRGEAIRKSCTNKKFGDNRLYLIFLKSIWQG